MSHQSHERYILNSLKEIGHTKWGWVFYRTSYTVVSNTLWPQVQSIIQKRALDKIKRSDTPQLAEMFDYKFISDRALDNANHKQLRLIHRRWANSDARNVQPYKRLPARPVRYYICMGVDEASMKSIVASPERPRVTYEDTAYVKAVRCNDVFDEQDIDEDEGWTLASVTLIVEDAYVSWDDSENEATSWYLYRQDPPWIAQVL